MRPGARLQAAIDILTEMQDGGRPAAEAVQGWARAHRFAGSKDRAEIAAIVFSVSRRRAELAWHMNEDTPRALALAERVLNSGIEVETLAALCTGEAYDAAPLSETERAALARPQAEDVPEHVRANVPEWVLPLIAGTPEGREAELRALNERAPVDLRVNTLKIEPGRAHERLAEAVAPVTVERGTWSPWALRLPAPAEGRAGVNLRALDLYRTGRIELQDEGSQLAALLTGARAGWQVVDLCAGAGGKTLALAQMMDNTGQIFACDVDRARLGEARRRLQRAGVRNVQTRLLTGEGPELADLEGRMDLVLLDVPCSGSGAWRRQPDARWRLTRERFGERLKLQRELLDRGSSLVAPGGRLAYVTCSLLEPENGAQIRAFLGRNPKFTPIPSNDLWLAGIGRPVPEACTGTRDVGSYLSPVRTGTDGFYVSVLSCGEMDGEA
ncbi:MAG: RsmB/NOP family class I SAM-dependent RNA methyltransferase [Alphaproteobacteria bacterium]